MPEAPLGDVGSARRTRPRRRRRTRPFRIGDSDAPTDGLSCPGAVAEAEQASAHGVDALVVQGAEPGGHQGSFEDHDSQPQPLIELLGSIRRKTPLPLIAAGGIATGKDIARALGSGATAAQLGSALLLATEAGTSQPHREALRRPTASPGRGARARGATAAGSTQRTDARRSNRAGTQARHPRPASP